MELGTRIREARLSAGLGVREMARKLHVSPSAVSQWEEGTSFPTIDNRVNISHLLEIPILDLLPERAQQPTVARVTAEEAILLKQFGKLPEPMRDTYLKLLLVQVAGLPDPPTA